MGSEQSNQRNAAAATQRDIDRALEKQRKVFEHIHEQKIKELLKEQEKKKDAQTAIPGSVYQPPVVTLERQHNAYYPTPTASIYPNLTAGYSAQGNMGAPGPSVAYYNGAPNQYMPNNNYYSNAPFVPTPPESYPSAPPSDDVSVRSRSQSCNRERTRDLNCQTCSKPFVEKVYQCSQRHNSCHLCKSRQVPCGQCKQLITARRNLPLEKFVTERRVQCPNSADGCRLHIKMADMGIHEKECPFKVMMCPSLGSSCNWSGKLSQLADHFDEMHPLHNQCDVDKEMLISNITNTSHTMHYIRIGNFNFLMHILVSETDSKIYMLVQLIGTKHSAAKWYYEIHMYKKSEPRRKFLYSDRCTSNIEPVKEIVKTGACAVISEEYARTLICNGSVAYKCYIKRDDDTVIESMASEAVDNNEQAKLPRSRRNNFKKYVKKNRPATAN